MLDVCYRIAVGLAAGLGGALILVGLFFGVKVVEGGAERFGIVGSGFGRIGGGGGFVPCWWLTRRSGMRCRERRPLVGSGSGGAPATRVGGAREGVRVAGGWGGGEDERRRSRLSAAEGSSSRSLTGREARRTGWEEGGGSRWAGWRRRRAGGRRVVLVAVIDGHVGSGAERRGLIGALRIR